jgi:predicted MFS family arabinose efflux permease
MLAGVLALNAADLATVGAVAPQLERAMGISNTQVGLLLTTSQVVGAGATLPFGLLADRVRRTRLLWASILLWSAAMIAGGAARSYWMLLVSRLALGAVTAAAGPVVASLTGDYFPGGRRATVYGSILTGEMVGGGFGLLISGELAGLLTWRASFWFLALVGLPLAWLIARHLHEPVRGGQTRPEEAGAEQTRLEGAARAAGARPVPGLVLARDGAQPSLAYVVGYVLRVRTNLVLIVASGLGYFYFTGIQTFALVYFRRRYSLDQSLATLLLVVIGLGAVAGVLAGGRLADRWIRERRVNARVVVGAAAFTLSALLFLMGLLVPTLGLAVFVYLLAAASLAAPNSALDAARLDVIPSWLWGRAEGVRTVLRTLLQAAAPILFGYVSDVLAGRAASPLSGAGGGGAGGGSAGAAGLTGAFLIMLIPLGAAGLVLLLAVRSYPHDLLTAAASERRQRSPSP